MSIKSLDAFVASCPGSAMTQRRADAGGSSLRATGEIYSISKEANERVIITQRSHTWREEIATCLDLDHDRLSRERKRGGGAAGGVERRPVQSSGRLSCPGSPMTHSNRLTGPRGQRGRGREEGREKGRWGTAAERESDEACCWRERGKMG